MKLFSISTMLLLTAAAFWGCTANDDESSPPEKKWQMSAVASKLGGVVEYFDDWDDNEENETRSLFWGGSSGNRFGSVWDVYDVAQIYKNGVNVGTMTPNTTGGERSTLTGSLSGSYSVGDELTLYLPSATMNFVGYYSDAANSFVYQDGTMGTMSRYFDYMQATAHVSAVDGSTITTEELTFVPRQCYMWLKFMDENRKFLHVKQVIITAASGMFVAERTMDGTTTYTSTLTINTKLESTNIQDYPADVWITMLNDYPGKDQLTYTIKTTDDKIWKGKSIHSFQTVPGYFTTNRRMFICSTVDVTSETSITPPDSDEPEVNDLTL